MTGVYTTSVSAAFGGNTTLIDFAIQWDKQLSMVETVKKRIAQLEADCVVDFALHATPTKSNQETIDSVADLIPMGIPSYKVYMVYRSQGRMVEDPVLVGLLEAMKANKGRLMVHAENASISEYLQERFIEQGTTSALDFPRYKPNLVEEEAISRVILFNHATGSRLFVAHLSTKEGLQRIREAQLGGDDVLTETCPQYLVFNEEVFSRPNGHRWICSPPIRSQADVDALWQGLADGSIAMVTSDHCGFGKAQKDQGDGDFTKTPNGLPGVEARLPLLYTHGVLKKRITVNQMVGLLSTNPAKVFGLYPQKGTILPGSDADIVIMDPLWTQTISADSFHGNVDWSPFEGMELSGFARTTILRGKALVHEGRLLGGQERGKFLKRKAVQD